MTDREKAIVMAYTGIAMLTGNKLDIFYKYLSELYGRPVYTHEIISLDVKNKAKQDFILLCKTEQPEPIRCCECKWWDVSPSSTSAPAFHRCRGFEKHHTKADEFCSRAERREDEE